MLRFPGVNSENMCFGVEVREVYTFAASSAKPLASNIASWHTGTPVKRLCWRSPPHCWSVGFFF